MADSYFPTLVSKSKDANAVANPIWVELTDGTTAISVTGNALDVNVDNTVTVSASDLDIRPLVAGNGATEDNILIFANTNKDGSGTDYVPLVDSDGQLQVDVLTMPALTMNAEYADDALFTTGTDYVLAFGAIYDDVATNQLDENDIGLLRCTVNRELKVDLSAQTLTAVKVSATSAANTETNPIYVQVVSGATSGNEVCNYDTSTVAGGDPDNHDYAVAGATFMLKSVIAASSGGMKFEVQVGPVGTLAPKAVGFIPKAGGTSQIFFDPPVEVPVAATGTVRVIRTNRESSSQDVYSTIEGYDL